jgi:hypothetical protein
MPLDIRMGYVNSPMVEMFRGKIVGRPEGKGDASISYTVTAVDNITDMSKEKKNRIFKSSIKSAIISQVIAENSFTPAVNIEDTNPIPPDLLPVQRNQTDLEFLYDRAKRWNCMTWSDGKVISFTDSHTGHDRGNMMRKRNLNDLGVDYTLNYRVGFGKNNISEIRWRKTDSIGGAPGDPGVYGSNETGEFKEAGDFTMNAYGKVWQLTPELKGVVLGNPVLIKDLVLLNAMDESSRLKEILKKYFVPVTKGSPTRKNLSHAPHFRTRGFEVTVNLIDGDPYLRPPRTGLLDCGPIGHSVSDLPGFLFPDRRKPQKYYINEVVTELRSSGMYTGLRMSV